MPMGYYVTYGGVPEGATQQALQLVLGDTRPPYFGFELSQVSLDSSHTFSSMSHDVHGASSTSV